MTYQVPASKRSIAQNRFEFEIEGVTYSLPSLKYLPIAVAEKFEDEKGVSGILLAAEDDRTKAALRSLDGDQLEGLMNAWQDASGVDVGESSASES